MAGRQEVTPAPRSFASWLPTYRCYLEKRLAQAAPVSQERRRRRPAQTTTTGLEVPRERLVDPHVFIVAFPHISSVTKQQLRPTQPNPTYRTANQRRPSTYRRSYLFSRSATSMGFPKPALTPEYFTFVVSSSVEPCMGQGSGRLTSKPGPPTLPLSLSSSGVGTGYFKHIGRPILTVCIIFPFAQPSLPRRNAFSCSSRAFVPSLVRCA